MTIFAGMLISLLLVQASENADPATTQPSTQPTLEQLRAEHKSEIDKELADIPKRGATTISKLISIELQDGIIIAKSLIEPTEGQVAYDPTDWPGWIVFTVGTPESAMMYFKHMDLSKPGEIGSYTNVITGIDYVQINRDSESEESMSQISIIQSRKFADENDAPLKLSVRISYEDGKNPDFSLNISADDFNQLRRRYPREVRQYLGPILKDLGAQSLLQNSDVDLAWQVLGADIEPSGKLTALLQEIVKKLSSDDFGTRAKAEDELAALGASAASALSHWDLNQLAADPRVSIESFIRSHQKVPPEQIKSLRIDPDFLLDLLMIDDPVIQNAVRLRLGDITGKTIQFPANLTLDEKTARIEELRKVLSPTTRP